LDASGEFETASQITASVAAAAKPKWHRLAQLSPDDMKDAFGVSSIMVDPDLGRVLGGEDDLGSRKERSEIARNLSRRKHDYGFWSKMNWDNPLYRSLFPAQYNQETLRRESGIW